MLFSDFLYLYSNKSVSPSRQKYVVYWNLAAVGYTAV